jgi:hypothetical protein
MLCKLGQKATFALSYHRPPVVGKDIGGVSGDWAFQDDCEGRVEFEKNVPVPFAFANGTSDWIECYETGDALPVDLLAA